MSELGQKILQDGLYEAGYMPHDVIALASAGYITDEECNLILFGTTKPTIKFLEDAENDITNP